MTNTREKLFALFKDTQGLQFTGDVVRQLQGPIVYLWLRGDEVLYVGRSRNGGSRPFTPRHPAMKDVQAGDTLMIWPVASREDAREAERILLQALRPKHNKRRALPALLQPAGLVGGAARRFVQAIGTVR